MGKLLLKIGSLPFFLPANVTTHAHVKPYQSIQTHEKRRLAIAMKVL